MGGTGAQLGLIGKGVESSVICRAQPHILAKGGDRLRLCPNYCVHFFVFWDTGPSMEPENQLFVSDVPCIGTFTTFIVIT